MYDSIIIGAGIGGLSAALRLRKQGLNVLLLEKNAYPGGKIYKKEGIGYSWDTGPSLFTLPQLVDELYELFGKKASDYYQYNRQEEACRYFFEDKTNVTFYTNINRLKKELSEKLAINGDLVQSYLERSAEKYNSIGSVFLETPIHKLRALPVLKLARIFPQLMRTNLLGSLHQLNKRALKDEKIVQIFDRYATYNGSNPFKASGILSMIPHLEQNIGTFFPKKGMQSIVSGLYELAKEEGVNFKFNQDIVDCKYDGTHYTITTTESLQAKQLVCAIDHLNFYKNIIKDKALFEKYRKQERSSSAIVFYWGIKKEFPSLGLHNIFFSNKYEEEFELIFDKKEIPFEGTVYVHISSKVNKDSAPDGCENWFVMLNTPAGITISLEVQNRIKKAILHKLERQLETTIENHIETEKVWTPEGISLDTGAFEGALYGAASNKKLSAIERHPNFSRKYKHLYFCGGTVHPGGGIPLALQSSKIIDNLILNEK